MESSGTFDIKTEHLDISVEGNGGIRLNRLLIRKIFEGDLKGKSTGEMLAAMTEVKGSVGYVAIEQVNGEIGGKTGAFILQHFGIMAGDKKTLNTRGHPRFRFWRANRHH